MSFQDDLEQMRAAGFSGQELEAFTNDTGAQMLGAGFNEKEVKDFIGMKDPRDAEIPAAQALVTPQNATGIMDSIRAGYQGSATGLAIRGKLPEMQVPESGIGHYAGIVSNVISDLPEAAIGAVAGTAGGAVTGPGALITGGAGAVAVPTALRSTLIDAYQKGDFKNFGDFWGRFKGIMWDTAKGYATGAAGGAGMAAAAPAGAVGALAGGTVAATVAQHELDLEKVESARDLIPSWQEFIDTGFVMLGMKAGMSGAEMLGKTFTKTGATPHDVIRDAQSDPTIVQDLASGNVPKAYETKYGPIPAAAELAPEHRAYEQNFATKLTGDFQKAVEEYNSLESSQGGKILNTDTARELSPDYLKDRTLSAAVHEPASWFVKQLYAQKLAEAPKVGEDPTVVFTAGGTGSGKSATMRMLPDVIKRAQIVYDTNMNKFDSSKQKVEQALAAGKNVEILYVFRDPVDALVNGALSRSAKQEAEFGSGRTVPLQEHANTHIGSFNTIKQLADEYAGDGRVKITAIDNSRGKGNAQIVPLEKLTFGDYTNLHEQLHQATREQYAQGTISANAYRGFTGKEAPDNSGSGGGKSQQAREAGNTDAVGKVLGKVNIGGIADKEPLTLDKIYTATLDDLAPLKRAVTEMAADVPTSANPYELSRLMRGAAGRAGQFLENGTYDFKTLKNTGPSLKAVLDPVKNDLDGFRAYAIAQRAIELEGRGIKSGIDLEAAKEVVADGTRKYDTALQGLLKYQDSLTTYLRDAGVVSKDAYAAMKAVNKSYVPFFRVIEDQEGFGLGRTVKNPIKAIKGSDRAVIDPLESIIKNTYAYTVMAERNAAVKAFYDLAKKSDTPEAFFEPSEAPKATADKAVDALDVPEEAKTAFRQMRVPLEKDQIGFFNDGEWTTIRVNPEVAEAFKGTDARTASMLVKILSQPARLLRAGATLTPDFMMRNIVRDQVSAFAYSKNGYVPFWDMARGIAGIMRQDGDYQNWLKSGGANAAMVSMDREYLQNSIFKLTGNNPEANFLDKTWNLAKKPIDMLRIASELSENATRLGEFKRGVKGKDSRDAILGAGFGARDVTLDFARIGTQTRAMNMITAFFNASMQGTDKMARAFKENPFGVTARVAAGITLPSVMLWAANHDDPRWKELPAWQRDLFWIVMTKDHIYRIPKPFELGVVFGSGVERMLDAISGNMDKADLNGFLQTMGGGVMPNFIPTFAQPIVEQVTNHSFFQGHALIPARVENMLPEYQYTEYTSELTKALAHVMTFVPGVGGTSFASPIMIDNYVRAWTGGMGSYALQAADAGLRKAGVLPDPVLPAKTLADIPVIKAFTVRYPSASAESIQKFQDDFQEKSKIYNTFEALANQGDEAAALKVIEAGPAAMAKLDDINKFLSEQNQLIRLIYKNPEIGPDEKRQLIDDSYYGMIEVTRQANEVMKEMDKALLNKE